VISLFSSAPAKETAPEDEAKRAQIQSVIDRAIEVPEVAIPEEMQAFFARSEESEKAEPEVNPWDVVKEFMRDGLTQSAA
jgi:hypothetical protein